MKSCGAPRVEPNADPERQTETRSTSQQTVIDTQPTTSQCHPNTEVEEPAIRRKGAVANFFASLQHLCKKPEEPKHDLKKQQRDQETLEERRQKSYEQTQKRQILREQWFKKQQQEQRLRLELHNQPHNLRHLRGQLSYDSTIIEQSTNPFDRQHVSEMVHGLRSRAQVQSPLYSQIVDKLESNKQELEEFGEQQRSRLELQKQKLDKLEDQQILQLELQNQQPEQLCFDLKLSEQPQNASLVQRQQDFGVEGTVGESRMNTHSDYSDVVLNERVIKDKKQYQTENDIGTSSSDRHHYIAPKNQPREPKLEEQQEEWQEQQFLQQLMTNQLQLKPCKRGLKRLTKKQVKNKTELQLPQKQRRHLQQQRQRRLDSFSNVIDVGNNCDDKFVRRISVSELTSQQKLYLNESGDNHHNSCYGNKIQEQYREQNVVIEQPRVNEAYTKVRNSPINRLEELVGLEQQQNNELHGTNYMLDWDDEHNKRIMMNHEEQLPLTYKNRLDVYQQGLTETPRSNKIEIGTEIKENTQYNTDLTIDKSSIIPNENRDIAQSHDVYQQYLPEIERLYKYSRTFKPLIENFVGTASSDKHYFIEESLTRTLLELDRIPAENCQYLRLCRRQVIKYIYDLMEMLDNRVQAAQ